jgi:lysozyme family protein
MAASSYDAALARLLVHEGGYTNDPRDPGGPTNFGITIHDYRKYVKAGATAADVKAMKVDEAKQIYREKYWRANGLSCDDLPAGVDDTLFDYRVNSGVGRADKVLRRVCALADKASNAALLEALAKRDPAAVINAVNDERLRFLRSLRTWPAFSKGWGTRVAEVRIFSLQLAAAAKDAKAPAPALPASPREIQQTGKGVVPLHSALKVVAQHGGKIVAGGGIAGGTATAQNETAWHWMAAHPAEFAAIAFGAVALVAGAAILINRQHRSQQEAATPGMVPVPVKA